MRKGVKNGRMHGHAGNHRTRAPASPTYLTWRAMWKRCTNPNEQSWRRYGAIGVTVCERWRSFEAFLADMDERPLGKTIDRYPNMSGNYEPGNCRWASTKEQRRN